MQWIDVLSRIVHVGTAITLVGGTAFLRLVLIPIAERLPEDTHRQLSDAVQSRWKRFVHAGILLFLLSGFYNYMRAIPSHKGDGLYHALIGTKILLALAVFFIASALVGRSPEQDSVDGRLGRPGSTDCGGGSAGAARYPEPYRAPWCVPRRSNSAFKRLMISPFSKHHAGPIRSFGGASPETRSMTTSGGRSARKR